MTRLLPALQETGIMVLWRFIIVLSAICAGLLAFTVILIFLWPLIAWIVLIGMPPVDEPEIWINGLLTSNFVFSNEDYGPCCTHTVPTADTNAEE